MVRMGIQLRVPAQDFSMLSLPPPHEWDVRWLRRLASLDCEQYRHYTTTLCRDVCALQQQANGGAPSGRLSAAARLQLLVSSHRHASTVCVGNLDQAALRGSVVQSPAA